VNKLTFECELITPMFMYGGDGRTLEIRPSEFKGMLRFWWRALHPELSLEELRKKEGEIFGNTDRKSSFRIRIFHNYQKKEYKALPHQPEIISIWDKKENKRKNVPNKKAFKLKAYLPTQNKQLEINFIIYSNDKYLTDLIKNLFILSSIIGGFGRRSRRGFGSLKINNVNGENFNHEDYFLLDNIETLIKNINPNFSFWFRRNGDSYPYIKNIDIGTISYNSYDEILKHIGQLTHDCRCGKAGVFKNEERFASPCYVSVIKKNDKYFPIITSLNIAIGNNKNLTNFQKNTISKFKKSILEKKNLCIQGRSLNV